MDIWTKISLACLAAIVTLLIYQNNEIKKDVEELQNVQFKNIQLENIQGALSKEGTYFYRCLRINHPIQPEGKSFEIGTRASLMIDMKEETFEIDGGVIKAKNSWEQDSSGIYFRNESASEITQVNFDMIINQLDVVTLYLADDVENNVLIPLRYECEGPIDYFSSD
jgi:hypothetical protein